MLLVDKDMYNVLYIYIYIIYIDVSINLSNLSNLSIYLSIDWIHGSFIFTAPRLKGMHFLQIHRHGEKTTRCHGNDNLINLIAIRCY